MPPDRIKRVERSEKRVSERERVIEVAEPVLMTTSAPDIVRAFGKVQLAMFSVHAVHDMDLCQPIDEFELCHGESRSKM